MEFVKPWYAESSLEFVDELRRETAPGHVLHDIPVSLLARRRDRDEVLFALNDGSQRVAKVHLTWARQRERLPWPHTTVFADIVAWVGSMRADQAEYGNEEAEFIRGLVREFPELQPVLDVHLSGQGGELLPHLFLADLVRWLEAQFSDSEPKAQALPLIKRLCAFMEAEFVRGDEQVRELLAVSFVENLPSTGELGASLRSFLGPTLEEEFRRVNW